MTTMTSVETRVSQAKLAPGEQAVVDEFAGVIRKHRDQDAAVLARLMTYALDRSMDGRRTRRDKLALALARGMEARRQLAEAEGGSLSSEETARWLNLSKTAVFKRLEAGRLLAWREERLQAARFPRWQFDANGQVLAGFEEVLALLNGAGRLDAWGKALFFLESRGDLGGRRPLDALRGGDVEAVSRVARAYVE